MRYARYRYRGKTSYGILDGESLRELRGDLFDKPAETGSTADLGAVELQWPCEPSKILAVGLNYKSHLGSRPAPKNPEIFLVPTSALLKPGGEIRIPPGAQNVHYEGELVAVIGKRARSVSIAEATDYIFGFTCGNDISERDWQRNDLQWWRAKGCVLSPPSTGKTGTKRLHPFVRHRPGLQAFLLEGQISSLHPCQSGTHTRDSGKMGRPVHQEPRLKLGPGHLRLSARGCARK